MASGNNSRPAALVKTVAAVALLVCALIFCLLACSDAKRKNRTAEEVVRWINLLRCPCCERQLICGLASLLLAFFGLMAVYMAGGSCGPCLDVSLFP